MSVTRNVACGPRPSALSPVFTFPVRVYWEDTDAGGVVYHAAYLRFLERARTEWLREQGIGQQQLREQAGVLFVVADLNVRYLSSARLDDELEVRIDTFMRRSASISFGQCILRRDNGTKLIEARVRAACIDATSYRPCRIPDGLLQETINA
ncbi:MAG TPA: tol-pal system-associated acyl-CoA thioesterase [Rudaea sp.]|nr:tol-pal system-associated acyl-CoA thioesterase [Rudaea sp.]